MICDCSPSVLETALGGKDPTRRFTMMRSELDIRPLRNLVDHAGLHFLVTDPPE